MKHFQQICFSLEFIWRIIVVNGGKVKKNKTTESFMVFSDKQQLYIMWYRFHLQGEKEKVTWKNLKFWILSNDVLV